MADLDGFPDGIPDEIQEAMSEWRDESEWDSVTFHGDKETGEWNVEVEYDDGSTETIPLGEWFGAEPDDWVWEIYDWIDDYTDADVDTDYSED